jgi:signal peptide peptidase SppA
MRYERLLTAVASIPWAIEPARGEFLADLLTRRVAGVRASQDELELAAEMKAARDAKKGRARPGGVALIAVHGVLTQRADIFDQMSGMVSTDEIGRLVDAAAEDKTVEAIVLDIDSPGGSVYGVEQLALKIRAAGEKKKVIAVADSLAASGAYWIAANANELVVTPDGEVGSIGVYLMHRDVSRALDATGQKVSFIKAGKHKTVGNPYEPLSAEGLAELQKGVDDFYDLFVRAVARGRNVSLTKVREGFGEGGMVRAKGAVAEGMADKVGTLDDVLGRYGLSTADLTQAARPDAGDIEVRRRKLLMD